jgi:hypothetical protein
VQLKPGDNIPQFVDVSNSLDRRSGLTVYPNNDPVVGKVSQPSKLQQVGSLSPHCVKSNDVR